MVAQAQYGIAQEFGGRGFIGEEFHHEVRAVIQRAGVQDVFGFVFFQKLGVGDVLAGSGSLHDEAGQDVGASQAEVETMGGNRVHAHGGIADQGGAAGGEAAGVYANQGIGVDAAGRGHLAELALQVLLKVGGQRFGAELGDFVQAAVVDGDDAVGHVFAKRQQGDGAAIAEAFVGGVFVGGGV